MTTNLFGHVCKSSKRALQGRCLGFESIMNHPKDIIRKPKLLESWKL